MTFNFTTIPLDIQRLHHNQMRPKLTVDRTEMQQSHSIQKEDEFPSAKGRQTIKAEIKTSVNIKKKKKKRN